MERVELRLLGGFEVHVDGEPVPATAWTHGRARDLVKLLALAPGHRLPRERVVEELWPRLDPGAGLANLHKAAHHGRRAIGHAGAVVLREGQVMLAPDARVETDVERFEASGEPDVYAGELLPEDRYAAGAEEKRAHLRARYLDRLRAAGRWEELAGEEPADEPAQRAVMRDGWQPGTAPGRCVPSSGCARRSRCLGCDRVRRRSSSTPASRAVRRSTARWPPWSASSRRRRWPRARSCLPHAPTFCWPLATAARPPRMPRRRPPWGRRAWPAHPSSVGTAGRRGSDRRSGHARPLAPRSDAERAAHLLAQAAAAWFRGDVEGARRAAAEAQPLAVAAGLEREARTAVQIQAMVAHSSGAWPAALRLDLDVSLRAPDLAGILFDGHLCVAEYALTSGEPHERIRALAEELHRSALRSGARRTQVFAATLLGEVSLIGGRTDDAVERLREAVRLSREIGAVSAEALASLRLGEAVRARGERTEGDTLFADALVMSRWSPLSGHLQPLAYAAVLRATDDGELGRERLEEAEAHLRGELVCVYCGMGYRVGAAIAASRAGQPDRAATFLSAAETTAALGRGGPWPAALDEARAELARARGRHAEAQQRLRAARGAFARDGRRFDADRVEARLAALA